MSLSDDHLSSPTKKNQQPPQGASFLSSKETEKKSETSTSQETQATNVLPLNRDEEVLKYRYGSFWENPNYYGSDNIVTNSTGNLLNPSGGMLGGNIGSQRDPHDSIQMNPTSGEFENNNDQSFLNLEDSDAPMLPLHNPQSEMGEEGYGTNTCELQSNISLPPCGSIESMMNAKRAREEIKMVPNPRPRVVNREQWPIKRILNLTDISLTACRLRLPRSSLEPYFQNHLPEAILQKLATDKPGITVNVYDHDTETTHKMCLVLQSNHYVLRGDWRKAFITRRGLREGQEIGMFWNATDSMLHFTVLDYANGRALAEEKKRKIH
ncbi:unnamed protein product [Arabis nemorensis]|uniref:TF-B3 domain-containing protein n=1 Tax=Arabis nemorensis TaxID=586526 RepID=A0A565BNS5_9BRAS|nr:unnamed protein product [Arabis nemorensis]